MLKLILFHIASFASSVPFSPTHSTIVASGLRQNIQLPVYYIHINLSDSDGNLLTTSPENDLKFSVTDKSGNRIRAQQELLDRHDGTFIARFRLWQSVSFLKASITDINGVHLLNSPIELKNVNHDQCHCPVSSAG